ncbi:unnamed protein product, partial [Arabidopsis halleri]
EQSNQKKTESEQKRKKTRMKFFSGITTWLNIYTEAQYGELSTKLTLLFTSMLTILMIFYGGHGKKYLEDEKRKRLVTTAGVCGMIYASFAFVDSFVRFKYRAIRIFDEISLIAGYACLWTLVFILFDKVSLGFLICSILVILGGIFVVIKRHSEGNIRGGRADPRFKEIVQELSNQGDANGVLQLAALMALMIKPEEPEAEELFRAVRANLNATRNNVPSDGNASNVSPGAATSLTQ